LRMSLQIFNLHLKITIDSIPDLWWFVAIW
jgi:hypothetical protein